MALNEILRYIYVVKHLEKDYMGMFMAGIRCFQRRVPFSLVGTVSDRRGSVRLSRLRCLVSQSIDI